MQRYLSWVSVELRHVLLSGGYQPLGAGLGGLDLRPRAVMQGWSPLHSAVSAGHDDVVQRLLSLGADVALQTSGGQTPLHYAVRSALLPNFLFLNSKASIKYVGLPETRPLNEHCALRP